MTSVQTKADLQRDGVGVSGSLLPVFFNREREARRLEEAILKRESLVICGPAGIGKTALVSKVIRGLPGELRTRCLYLKGLKDLQDMLRQLIRGLYEVKDPNLRQQLYIEGVSVSTFEAWVKALSTSRLRGTLYRTVERGDYRIFLDHVPSLTRAVAKVIKELFWMRKTPVYLLVRDAMESRISEFSRSFYWGDREQLSLQPLPAEAATKLLESCIGQFGLSQFDLVDFREEIIELSKQVPGAIVQMCALAADPRYRYGSRIKTKSVYIDYLMSGQNLTLSDTKRSSA
jgi:AAA+ ATPase superfamily predicted ATPase